MLDVVPGAPGWSRRLDSPLVGRDAELDLLKATFEEATVERACRVVTVIGAAGVGKSRLTTEFVNSVGTRATVASGRCLSYGEGITFWPLAEILRDAAGVGDDDTADEVRARITGLVARGDDADLVQERLSAVLGHGAPPGIQETFGAARRTFRAARRGGPRGRI